MNKSTSSTPNLEKLNHLFGLLHSPHVPKKRNWLADKCGVDERTVQRMISWMKSKGAPLGYDRKKRGYYFQDDSWLIQRPPMIITQKLLTTLLIARKAVTQYAGTPLETTLQQLFETLTGKIISEIPAGSAPDVNGVVSFSPSCTPQVVPVVWDAIFDGLVRHRAVQIMYRGRKDRKPVERQINPYSVACLEGVWYVFAGAPDNAEVRQYALHRASLAKVTKLPFTPPPHVDYARGSFNQFVDQTATKPVTVRFDAEIASVVLGYRWHPQQKVVEKPDGTVEVSFPASTAGPKPYYHVLRWVLSFGKNVEVLNPPEFRKLVRETTEEMARRHRL